MHISTPFRIVLSIVAAIAPLVPVVALAHTDGVVGDYELTVGFLNEPAYEGEPNGVSLRIVHAAGHGATGMETPAAADAHGALINEVIQPGGVFEFTADHAIENVAVSVHVHPQDFIATVMVSHDAPATVEFIVTISDTGISPELIEAQTGTVIKFENMTSVGISLMSGDNPATSEPVSAPVTGIAESLNVNVTHVPTGAKKEMKMREAFGDPGHYVANFIPTAPGVYRFKFTGDINGTKLDETFESGPETFSEIEAAKEIQFPTLTGSLREVEGATRGAQAAALEADDAAASARSMATTGIIVGAVGIATGLLGIAIALRRKSALAT